MARIFMSSLLWWLFLATWAFAADPEPVQTPVFQSGHGGYNTYRIPSLIVTKRGTVLAFCEGRKDGRGDAGNIDLILRRSLDGGHSWQEPQIVWDDGPNTCGNPCPVVEQSTGTVWLLLTHNLGDDKESAIVEGKSRGSRTVWITRSTDDGATWLKPVEITSTTKRPDWTWYATGPGVGIQMTSGRLVIPCDNKVASPRVWQSHVIFSDDQGATWKLGGVAGPKCNESQVIQRADGSLLLNMRSQDANRHRLVSTSNDGGLTWAAPVEDPVLIEPVCQGSLLRYPAVERCVLFSNPASTKREKLTVRVSLDDAATWPHARILQDGPAAYSCLTILPDGQIGCLYERGEKHPYEMITLARFPMKWVIAGDAK